MEEVEEVGAKRSADAGTRGGGAVGAVSLRLACSAVRSVRAASMR